MMTDPVADMLTRIRNAGRAGHAETISPFSRMKLSIGKVLKEEGFIDDVQVEAIGGRPVLRIKLRIHRSLAFIIIASLNSGLERAIDNDSLISVSVKL